MFTRGYQLASVVCLGWKRKGKQKGLACVILDIFREDIDGKDSWLDLDRPLTFEIFRLEYKELGSGASMRWHSKTGPF